MNKYNKQRLFEMMHKVGKMPLMEIDRLQRFADMKDGCLNHKQVLEIFNYHLERSYMTGQKPKLNRAIPFLHASNIPIVDGKIPIRILDDDSSKEDDLNKYSVDIEEFAKLITQEPKGFIDKNQKMIKTAFDNSIVYDFGLPAYRSLVFDLEKNEFFIVNTCIGAGKCYEHCYAKRGRYVMYPAPNLNGLQILNFLLNFPDRFEKRLYNEMYNLIKNKKNMTIYFRWNDTGDFFVKEYFRMAYDTTKKLREEGYNNVYSYAHTKVADVYHQGNEFFITSFSTDANYIERSKVDLTTAKTSEYVPKHLFDFLFIKKQGGHYLTDKNGQPVFKDPINGPNKLKEIISKKYDVDINSLLLLNELLKTPPKEGVTWNAIVKPRGDGDNAALRLDVRRSFLMHH